MWLLLTKKPSSALFVFWAIVTSQNHVRAFGYKMLNVTKSLRHTSTIPEKTKVVEKRGKGQNRRRLQEANCADFPSGWHDAEGPWYNCEWYGLHDCPDEGRAFENLGYIAQEACCSCGGGREENPVDLVPVDEVRFNKIYFSDNWLEIFGPGYFDDKLPLFPGHYPISRRTATWLKKSMCWSVLTEDDLLPGGVTRNLEQILAPLNLLDGPSQPSSDSDKGERYWRDFNYVIQTQIQRIECNESLKAKDVWPYVMTEWNNYTLEDVAKAVHNEYPGYWQAKYIETLVHSGPNGFLGYKPEYEIDHDIIPERSEVEFLHGQVLLAELNTWSFATVSTYAFHAKWYFGRARPEEMAIKIRNGEVDLEEVPEIVRENLSRLDFRTAAEFTAYPEGSPTHPAWPAMHSASSNMSLWMAVLFNLTQEQWQEIKNIDYSISFARTMAGVHYPSDNIDGLNFGQEVISHELPDWLWRTVGSNRDKVREKIEKVRFNWKDYDHTQDSTTIPITC